jgi:hypothetical protein
MTARSLARYEVAAEQELHNPASVRRQLERADRGRVKRLP